MASWHGDVRDEEEDVYTEGAWAEAFRILWGWAWKIALALLVIALVLYAASRIVPDGTKNCDLCGTPYKGGYSVSIQKDESLVDFAKKALAKAGEGEQTEEKPVQANHYEVCPDCEARVRAALDSMRGTGNG